MTAETLYRLAETPGYTVEPRADNVRWISSQSNEVLRVHSAVDGRFHWTIFYINTAEEVCFIASSDIPAESSGYGTKELAVAAVTEYYKQRQWRKVTL